MSKTLISKVWLLLLLIFLNLTCKKNSTNDPARNSSASFLKEKKVLMDSIVIFQEEGNYYLASFNYLIIASYFYQNEEYDSTLYYNNLARKYSFIKENEIMRSDALYQLKQYEASVGALDTIIFKAPSIDLYHSRGLINMKLSNYKSAIEDFNSVIKYDSSRVESMLQLGYSYGLDGNLDKAIGILNYVKKKFPDNCHAYYYSALVYEKFNMAAEKEGEIAKSIDLGCVD